MDEEISLTTTKKSLKPRGGNSPVIGSNGVKSSKADNSRMAHTLMEIHSWGGVDRSDLAAMDDRFWKFVDYCEQNGIRVTNQLAYYALGIDRDTAYDWEHGRARTREHAEFIKMVKNFCSAYREMLGAEGKINPVTLVWWQKNYDGFRDQTEVVVTTSDRDIATNEELLEKYKKGLPEETYYEAEYTVEEE